MTKSNLVRKLLRGLLTLTGAGLGAAGAMFALQLVTMVKPAASMPPLLLVGLYGAACLVGAAVFYFLAEPITGRFMQLTGHLEQRLEKMPMSQMLPAILWMVCGLVIAALLAQMLGLLGEGMFITALAAMLYVLLGTMGWSLGWKRGKDFLTLMRGEHRKEKSARRHAGAARPKVLDTSAIIDGRVLEVCRTGFLEGDLIAPQFVLDELRHVADSADPVKRARGRRGLDMLQKLQEDERVSLQVDATDFPETTETDVKLLKLAQQLDGAVLTGDYNLSKVGAVAGVRVLSLNDLATALKPVAMAGETLTVRVIKEGKEYGQGVAYMPDGTMIIVEGGRDRLNEEVQVLVTSVLQTSAGRMIFTKVKE